jgi:hypothetical protein
MELDRPEPYFKYNYIENIDPASTTNTWQVKSFSGLGSNTTGAESCGCRACPSMTCNLAEAGVRTGALAADTGTRAGNMAYNPSLEACLGGSGSCLSLNGDACCIGTSSYEYRPTNGPCSESCRNFWSSITSKKPLSALWSEMQNDLPKLDMSA